MAIFGREPPHTMRVCYCTCHCAPDLTITQQRWSPRTDPIGRVTACSRCVHLHYQTVKAEDDGA